MSTEQCLAGFFDGSALKLVLMLKAEGGNAWLLSPHGKRFRVPERQLLCVFPGRVEEADLPWRAEALEKHLKVLAAGVDSTLLWESMPQDGLERGVADFAAAWQGGKAPVEMLAAVFLALLDDVVHYKRRNLEFTVRTPEQAQEQATALRRRREREEYEAQVIPWLRARFRPGPVDAEPASADKHTILSQLEAFLQERQANDGSRLLELAIGDAPVREAAFQVLLRSGHLPPDSEPFLILNGIPARFSQKCLAAAASVGEIPARRDELGHLEVFSIDEEETRDVDDALSLEPLDGGGWRLGIHIADVSAWVAPGDPFDAEAARRTTSVYLPTCTVHMLPDELALGRASLLPGEPRPALSYFHDFDASGSLCGEPSIRPSRVAIAHKLSYGQCDGGGVPESVRPQLAVLDRLAESLERLRLGRGALKVARPELRIKVRHGEIEVSETRMDSRSRAMVAEFMILANQISAEFCRSRGIPCLYRTQEPPEQAFQQSGAEYDALAFDQAVRGLRKSRLQTQCGVHAALGVAAYTQATSPLRRWSDMLVQRQIAAVLQGQPPPLDEGRLAATVEDIERQGGEVREAQKQAEQYWLLEYLRRNYLGAVMPARVVGRLPGGLNAELEQLCTRFKFSTPQRLQIGERVLLRLDTCEPEKGLALFVYVETLA
ncbi:MAG: hypothetical protein RL095_2848 [Verrucomicrobiota bacterium]|jgi:exoribonuclease-2